LLKSRYSKLGAVVVRKEIHTFGFEILTVGYNAWQSSISSPTFRRNILFDLED
jgi:hypothetical protein